MSEQCKCGHPYSEHFPRSTDMSNAGGYGPCLHNFCACKEYASEPEHIEVAPGQQDGPMCEGRCGACDEKHRDWEAYALKCDQLRWQVEKERDALEAALTQAHDLLAEMGPPVREAFELWSAWQHKLSLYRAALAASQPGKETR